MPDFKKVRLVLADGTEYHGYSFGHETSISGEVVFNTAMTGYVESLTDPSYRGQILVATYPLIGNYGVPGKQLDANNIPLFYESDQIQVSGLVVSDYSFEHSHWNAEKSLADWFKEHKLPGIYGIDTRALTKKLRESGTMLGKILFDNQDVAMFDPGVENVVAEVSVKEPVIYGSGSRKILLVDCGVKNNIIRCFLKRDAQVIRVPWDYDFSDMEYDGLFISNGPGNPEVIQKTVDNIRKALEKRNNPVFGICMGNLLLGLASGARTYKLKYGHRSHNQPVQQVGTHRCFITSQNHGYTVDIEQISGDWELLFVNNNDGTCEGIRHKTRPIFSAQFHPEATGGPTDTEILFDDFLDMVDAFKQKK
ncbi:MAG TPA: glutamine-hydrolyzing carbamoyl-phosphate synthase small subunit [Bacteroidales bacterium]|nr:MAG: Carbamoyl-phosphate synthase small chain [Bacteroidetes bacterium ADurb.Bin217]HPM12059.1 glutamine-hydrolyzing carbamoyl-phosphate synthase small subunit [Bacteroidales bacterium]